MIKTFRAAIAVALLLAQPVIAAPVIRPFDVVPTIHPLAPPDPTLTKLVTLVRALARNTRLWQPRVKFTETRGGTNLGVRIDPAASDFSSADYEQCTGKIRIVGNLVLDYVPVRCVAEVDLSTFEGTGHLEVTGRPIDEDPNASVH